LFAGFAGFVVDVAAAGAAVFGISVDAKVAVDAWIQQLENRDRHHYLRKNRHS